MYHSGVRRAQRPVPAIQFNKKARVDGTSWAGRDSWNDEVVSCLAYTAVILDSCSLSTHSQAEWIATLSTTYVRTHEDLYTIILRSREGLFK